MIQGFTHPSAGLSAIAFVQASSRAKILAVKGASFGSDDACHSSCRTAQSRTSPARARTRFARSLGTSSLRADISDAKYAKMTPTSVAEPRSTAACQTASGADATSAAMTAEVNAARIAAYDTYPR